MFISHVSFVLKCCIVTVFARELIVPLLIAEPEYYAILPTFIACIKHVGFFKKLKVLR